MLEEFIAKYSAPDPGDNGQEKVYQKVTVAAPKVVAK